MPQSFDFVVSPTSISIEPGGQATVTITATGYNGFSAPINIQASGLPAGVTPLAFHPKRYAGNHRYARNPPELDIFRKRLGGDS